MHSAIVSCCFLLILIVPCLVALHSSSNESRTGYTGEYAMASLSLNTRANRPWRLRIAADVPFDEDGNAAIADKQNSRIHALRRCSSTAS
jgi:hypothetical protein